MKTLPEIAREIPGCSLDVLRVVIRKNPELRALGTMYGPVKLYTAGEVKKLRDAYAARKKAAEVVA